jgi:hypothetical protein
LPTRLLRAGGARVAENRRIADVNTLQELPPRLRQSVLSREDKESAYDDAVVLAQHEGLHPDPTREHNPYNEFISNAMA